MLTRMSEKTWDLVVDIFRQVRSKHGTPGRDDRLFLEATHYFAVHNIIRRAPPAEFGNWNTVWTRFSRLSKAGTFEAFFQALVGCSETAGLIEMFDSTTCRAHVSAAGATASRTISRPADPVAALAPKSISSATSTVCQSTSI